MRLYDIKLETNVGDVMIDDVYEYTFSRWSMFYSTADEQVGKIACSFIKRAYRQLHGSSRWVEIKLKRK